MKRIAITLVISIIVFVGTLVSTNIYVSKKSTETADYLNEIALDNFRTEMESDIIMTEQSIRCFLSGQRFVSASDSGLIVIDEEHLNGFRKGIRDNLFQFMKVNRYYENSMFIIDDEINREYYGHEGFYAPSVSQGDTTLYNLSEYYNFTRSSNYQQVKRERKKLWCAPSATSPVAGKYMTIYVPIVLSSGRFFGAFAVSLDDDMISDKLKKHLPYGEEYSAIFLLDENGRVFSSSHSWIKEHQDEEELKRGIGRFTASDSTSSYIPMKYGGIEYYGYRRATSNAPWTICTLCETGKIYQDANRFKAILFATSLLGMLLMLACCYVVSRQIRSNLRKKAQAEEELKLAANVQMSLLKPTSFSFKPQLTPVTLNAFIRPAREAGGDLYDYVQKGDELIFCIGDVSGKGMSAALFMTQVISLFRNAVRNTSNPAEITCQINDVLAQDNPDLTFCTFFVGVLSPLSYREAARGGATITFCNAGHNPAVLIPSPHEQPLPIKGELSEGLRGSSFLTPHPNIAMGLIEGFRYQSETITLERGDSLLLYTDGVTEAKNSQHHDFGDDRLIATLSHPSNNIIQSVLKQLHQFVGNCEQSDDITMLQLTI